MNLNICITHTAEDSSSESSHPVVSGVRVARSLVFSV